MKEYIGGWMPIGPYEQTKADPFGWISPVKDGRQECHYYTEVPTNSAEDVRYECAIHCWGSTNPDKECPFCEKERHDLWPFD